MLLYYENRTWIFQCQRCQRWLCFTPILSKLHFDWTDAAHVQKCSHCIDVWMWERWGEMSNNPVSHFQWMEDDWWWIYSRVSTAHSQLHLRNRVCQANHHDEQAVSQGQRARGPQTSKWRPWVFICVSQPLFLLISCFFVPFSFCFLSLCLVPHCLSLAIFHIKLLLHSSSGHSLRGSLGVIFMCPKSVYPWVWKSVLRHVDAVM